MDVVLCACEQNQASWVCQTGKCAGLSIDFKATHSYICLLTHSISLVSLYSLAFLPLAQTYTFRSAVRGLAVTQSGHGLTNKQLLLSLASGQLLGIDRSWLDPRRVLEPTAEEREEGVVPYKVELPFNTLDVLSRARAVAQSRGVASHGAGLESTALVFQVLCIPHNTPRSVRETRQSVAAQPIANHVSPIIRLTTKPPSNEVRIESIAAILDSFTKTNVLKSLFSTLSCILFYLWPHSFTPAPPRSLASTCCWRVRCRAPVSTC